MVNITIPGEHLLNPGTVSQGVIPAGDRVRVVVVGEGNAPLSVFGDDIAENVFQQKIEQDITRAAGGFR